MNNRNLILDAGDILITQNHNRLVIIKDKTMGKVNAVLYDIDNGIRYDNINSPNMKMFLQGCQIVKFKPQDRV